MIQLLVETKTIFMSYRSQNKEEYLNLGELVGKVTNYSLGFGVAWAVGSAVLPPINHGLSITGNDIVQNIAQVTHEYTFAQKEIKNQGPKTATLENVSIHIAEQIQKAQSTEDLAKAMADIYRASKSFNDISTLSLAKNHKHYGEKNLSPSDKNEIFLELVNTVFAEARVKYYELAFEKYKSYFDLKEQDTEKEKTIREMIIAEFDTMLYFIAGANETLNKVNSVDASTKIGKYEQNMQEEIKKHWGNTSDDTVVFEIGENRNMHAA